MNKREQIIETVHNEVPWLSEINQRNIADAILALDKPKYGTDLHHEDMEQVLKEIEQKESKTAEEILDKYLGNYPWIYWARENAIKAMEEYAAQSRQPEITNEEIEEWVKANTPFNAIATMYGKIEGAKAMRDHPEQFKNK
jgi:hypothetical protein